MKRILLLLLLVPGLLKAQIIDVGPIVQPTGGAAAITVSVTSLPSFTTNEGNASTSASFSLSGSGLSANIVVTPPTGYELSKDNSNFFSSLTYNQSGGSVSSQPCYVRITNSATGTPAGNITLVASPAASRTVAVTGTVISNSPTITITRTALDPFNYVTGTPPTAQTWNVSGSNLTANVVVTPPSWMEISGDGNNWQSSFTLTRSGSILSNQPVPLYARGKGANTPGAYSGNITHTSTGATQRDIAANATVTSASGTTAKFNMSQAVTSIAGWTNIFGPNGADKTFTDATTGWVVNFKGSLQSDFFGTTYAFDGQGAASSSDALFPAATVANIFINSANSKWTGSNYLFEVPNLPAGTYKLYIFASVRSTWNSAITTPEFHAKFGSAADQMKNDINLQNNTTSHFTFVGTISSGDVLKFSFNPDAGLSVGAAAGCAFIIEKQ